MFGSDAHLAPTPKFHVLQLKLHLQWSVAPLPEVFVFFLFNCVFLLAEITFIYLVFYPPFDIIFTL